MANYNVSQRKPVFVFNGTEFSDLDQQIKEIEKEFRVKEIDITFKEDRLILNTIKSSSDGSKFVREVIGDGVEIQ